MYKTLALISIPQINKKSWAENEYIAKIKKFKKLQKGQVQWN
jgi:hypothetical protein